MERLTHRKEDWYWKDEEFWLSAENPSLTKTDAVYYKLAEFEDFMEEYGFENIDELKEYYVNLLELKDWVYDRIDGTESDDSIYTEFCRGQCDAYYKVLHELDELHTPINNKLKQKIDQLKQQLIAECKEHQEFCKVADAKVKELEQQLAEKEKKIRDLNQETRAFGIFELNGRLTDCIIELTENIDDNNILRLFEILSQKFYEANLAEMEKLKGGE